MADSLRSKENQVSGSSAPLPQNVLPTKGDVLKRLHLSRQTLTLQRGNVKIPVPDIVSPVLDELLHLWERASIPTISIKGIEKALIKLWGNIRSASKNECLKAKWEEEKDSLFDICSCKCPQISCEELKCSKTDCNDAHISCTCDQRVPSHEVGFLLDQRGARKMIMIGVDKKVTQAWSQAEKRKKAFESQQEREKKRKLEVKAQQLATSDFFSEANSDSDDDDNAVADPNWEADQPSTSSGIRRTRNLHCLPRTGQACDRRGVSSEAAADIINAFAIDMGLLTAETKLTMTVDKKKLDRWRKHGRETAQKEQLEQISSKPVTGFYFDGRKDLTLTKVMKGEKVTLGQSLKTMW